MPGWTGIPRPLRAVAGNRAAASYAAAQLEEPLSLDDLADKAGLSLSRFKARFREETGETPRSYINRLKIQQAQAFLRQGDSITAVSQRLGFSTPNYFATVFRRFTAMSPVEYARRSGGPDR